MSVAEVLDSTTNRAVVQLPNRQFPGSVIQGDTLFSLLRELRQARELVNNRSTIADHLDFVLKDLETRLEVYEQCLHNNQIDKPYFDESK